MDNQLQYTANSRVRDEVAHFAGLNGAPLDPQRLRAVDRFLTQFAYACATGAALSGLGYAIVAIKATVSQ